VVRQLPPMLVSRAGAAVSDTTGAAVGTIESVNGDLAVVSTGTNKVSVPVSSFGQGDKGPILAMTRAQLDAAASGAAASEQAALDAQLAPGSTVYDTNGAVVGKVDSKDAQFATIAIDNQKVKLPLNAFAKGDTGAKVGMTADQIKSAAASATQSAQAASSAMPQN